MTIKKKIKTGKWSVDFCCEGKRIQKRGFSQKSDAEKFKAKIIEVNVKKRNL
jgi:hypothetical protein